jgi:hypothetical protein
VAAVVLGSSGKKKSKNAKADASFCIVIGSFRPHLKRQYQLFLNNVLLYTRARPVDWSSVVQPPLIFVGHTFKNNLV